MFYIRLSPTFSASDCAYEIDLPQAPAAGDTIQIDEGGGHDITYRVIARRFDVAFHKGEQLAPERPQVLLHVVEV